MPGLDGLRAVAVAAVVAYHLQVSWLPGGLLGVGVFFTLSGYLITDLLLGGWERNGRFSLADFWRRRARRLLPALVVLLAVVVVWVAVGDPSQLHTLRGAAISGLLYVNNWWQIAHHVSYFARFGQPSPLGNLWSLAVEEQFYLLWPWALLGAVALFGRWSRRSASAERHRASVRRLLAVASLALAAASAIEMAVLFHPGMNPTRVYDGTDTRAFALLVGAALAAVRPNVDAAPLSALRLALVDAAGAAGLATIGVLMWRTSQYSAFMYQGGMVLLSAATALVILSVVHPASHVGRLLGLAPLRGIGLVSYGIYLWHYPVIVLSTPPGAHAPSAGRAAAQVGATLALAVASWYLVESPIRRGALGRLAARLRDGRRRGVPRAAIAAASGGTAVVAAGAFAFAGVLPSAPAGELAANVPVTLQVRHMVPSSHVIVLRSPQAPGGVPGWQALAHHVRRSPPARPTSSGARTSCSSVVHIGDSTSESLVSSTYLPTSAQLPAQYAQVGVSRVVLEISGARSLVETLPGQMNGTQVARQLLAQGYQGCWVVALGTNDAANIAVGSPVSAATRIDTLMSLLHGQPVLWVNVVSQLGSGPYSDANMQAWDEALVQACGKYPNMRVYDWAAVAQPSWFISDGIHYGSAGSAARAADIARALAAAFPLRTGNPARAGATCVVH